MHPPFAFLRNYILRGGFRDGAAGLLVSVLNSYYVFLKLVKLWELQRLAGKAARIGGSAARAPSPESRDLTPRPVAITDVLPAHRHGADVARRAEPGAGDRAGLRALGHRTMLVAHPAASCASARKRGST